MIFIPAVSTTSDSAFVTDSSSRTSCLTSMRPSSSIGLNHPSGPSVILLNSPSALVTDSTSGASCLRPLSFIGLHSFSVLWSFSSIWVSRKSCYQPAFHIPAAGILVIGLSCCTVPSDVLCDRHIPATLQSAFETDSNSGPSCLIYLQLSKLFLVAILLLPNGPPLSMKQSVALHRLPTRLHCNS